MSDEETNDAVMKLLAARDESLPIERRLECAIRAAEIFSELVDDLSYREWMASSQLAAVYAERRKEQS